MRFDRGRDGAWLVDPRELADRLDVSSSYLQRQMKLGRVTSRVEVGSGADAGRHRVTVRLARAAWQAIFDRDGRLISESKL